MKKADIIAGILGLLLSTYASWEALKFPEDKVLLLGPHFFPILLSVGLGILSIVLIGKALRGKASPSKESFSLKDSGVQRAGIALLATVVYCLLLNVAGFILTSTIYLFFLMYLLKHRGYAQMAAVALGAAFAVYAIFRIALNITLPTGFLG